MIYFVSGHIDLTIDEFVEHYVPKLEAAVRAGAEFVTVDAPGADFYAQSVLRAAKAKVTIYHMFTKPRNKVDGVSLVGGFKSHNQKDAAMTKVSDADIAWVRPGKDKSGTSRNLIRRAKISDEALSSILD